MKAPSRILSLSELKSKKGIPFSRQHVHRLVKLGRFPRPIKVGEATNGWLESEIDAWLVAKIAERDQKGAGISPPAVEQFQPAA
jgi:prophage regulatory protein